MTIALDHTTTQNFGEAISREWLETNGLGGWASSTIANIHTRRYHGLLVAATRPPVGRVVLLSKLEETLVWRGGRHALGGNVYPGAVQPQGYRHLSAFSRDLFPSFTYAVDGIRLEKRVAGIHGENTTVIDYRLHEAPGPLQLELRPFVAGRDYHALTHANREICLSSAFDGDIWIYRAYPQLPTLYLLAPGASFTAQPDWYYNFEYLADKQRGQDFQEDLFTPGVFTLALAPGERASVITSTSPPHGKSAVALLAAEKARRERLTTSLPEVSTVRSAQSVLRELTLAANQFIVRRGGSQRTIIAGYHWFTDWGRDTMIALPGLTLVTGRFEVARDILETFVAAMDQGMLPNRFPDSGETPEYNTVDATLWFFVAAYKYFQYSGDRRFLQATLLPAMAEMIDWHRRGTRYGIRMASDGLLTAGEPGVQLTWMDVKIGDWVVTPRHGKAVEINALWYNAVTIYAHLLSADGQPEAAAEFHTLAAAIQKRFIDVFWHRPEGYLFDVVTEGQPDPAIRPNQIFALSLPFPLLGRNRARQVLKTVETHLLTPMGLRSLSPRDPAYQARYQGDGRARDAAYHQGTVWAWLLGPYLTALVRVRGKTGRRQGMQRMAAVGDHFARAGIGQVSEIFDGDPPHAPRGCVAQAWSVAEILRAYVEDLLDAGPPGHDGRQDQRGSG